ncbi:MAG TPA: phosphoribosylanthranilate isomerase [Opitutaceae bacterium]
MIDGIRFKVCGLTSLIDAELADKVGADCLGFIFHPESPRRVTPAQYEAMAPRLPSRRKVAVLVEPTLAALAEVAALGFDFFQIHFRHDRAEQEIASWAETVGINRLWLAPKLPPETDVNPRWLALTRYVLMDTFHAGFGGSGKVGDWGKFGRHQAAHPKQAWILAGGLTPENIGEALAQSGARFVDVNSGVEAAPGVKDPERLKKFVVAIHRARTPAAP